MMEAASTSEILINFTILYDATSQKIAIFVFTAVRISDPEY
jgi:hypothetical protein